MCGRLERIDRDGLLNAADLQRLFIIERFDLAAVHRRVFNRGEDHAVSMGIHAKDGLACADVAQIVNALVFSNVSPRCGGLELQLLTLRHRQATGGRGERPVASAAAARPMNDFVEFGGALRTRDFPLGGGGRDEHRSGGGAGLTECVVEISNRSGSVRILIAVLGVPNSLFDLHALPIGIQLVGRHERQRGSDAGSHFGPMGHDEDGAIGFDPEIHARIEG